LGEEEGTGNFSPPLLGKTAPDSGTHIPEESNGNKTHRPGNTIPPAHPSLRGVLPGVEIGPAREWKICSGGEKRDRWLQEDLDVEGTRISAILSAIRKDGELLQALAEKLQNVTVPVLTEASSKAVQETDAAATDGQAESEIPEDDLRPLPEGISSDRFIEQFDLAEFLKDPRWNPGRKKPTRVEIFRAIAEATLAKCRMEILESQFRLEVAESMDKLRDSGDFVDYGPGESPVPMAGVFTVGEDVDQQTSRIYYLYPEQHPGIYAKRNEKKKIAEMATRRLISMFAE
jgi:hypothetical protein